MIPAIPAWDSVHPAIVHFPVALLLVVPLFLLIGVLMPAPKGRPYLTVSLVLMFLGTAGAWVAVATGEATAELVERNAAIQPVLEHHEQLAELTRIVFTILTVVFAAVLLVPKAVHREAQPLYARIIPAVFLVVYAAGALLIANTAHNGGRLVHEFGSSPSMAAADPGAEADAPHLDAD